MAVATKKTKKPVKKVPVTANKPVLIPRLVAEVVKPVVKIKRQPKKKPLAVKVVGCGGIGGYLLDPLCRYLQYSHINEVEVSIIDGDRFEERNKERQVFAAVGDKATVTKEKLAETFPYLSLLDKPVFLNQKNIKRYIKEADTVFVCVDNHKTRKLISDYVAELKNVTVISGGNDYTDGNVIVHIKKDGKDLTPPVASKYHPEIVNATDKNPGDEVKKKNRGCQAEAPGAPQLVMANLSAASKMLNAYYALLQAEAKGEPLPYSEAYFDILTNKTTTVLRK